MFPDAEVSFESNCIRLAGKLDRRCLPEVCGHLAAATEAGAPAVTLDLGACTGLFPDGSVPVAALLAHWRQKGLQTTLVLPDDERLARLMVNSNFAHFAEPAAFPAKTAIVENHLPVTQFESPDEHWRLADRLTELAMEKIGHLSRDIITGFGWSVNEVMDNVLTHAEAPAGGFVQATTLGDRIAFAVADCGRGILASMREGFDQLRNDVEAIEEAVKAGVTRDPAVGQGNGLAGALRISTGSGGSFTVISGAGVLTVWHDTATGTPQMRHWELQPAESFPGTLVCAQILRNPAFNLNEAFGFAKLNASMFANDLIESKYETEDGTGLLVQIKDLTTGCGSRPAGRALRTRCLNLMEAEPGKSLEIDWQGVPLISSSFADEAIAKLFLEVGPLNFGARVKLHNMEPLVRQLIEKAILQRTAQSSPWQPPGSERLKETDEESEA